MKTRQPDLLKELQALEQSRRQAREPLPPPSYRRVAQRHDRLLNGKDEDPSTALLGHLPLTFRERHPRAMHQAYASRPYALAACAAALLLAAAFILGHRDTYGNDATAGEYAYMLTAGVYPPAPYGDILPLYPVGTPQAPERQQVCRLHNGPRATRTAAPVTLPAMHDAHSTALTPPSAATHARTTPDDTPPSDILNNKPYNSYICNAALCDASEYTAVIDMYCLYLS